MARYPFLPQAGAYVEDQGPQLADLLADRVYAPARRRGQARVLAALEEAEIPARALSPASAPRELIEELLAYVYARILVCAAKDAHLVRRHALAEAVRVKALLEEDDAETISRCARAVGLEFEPDGETLHAHFTEYLRYAVHLKDMEWKLVRQPLKGGVVAMDARAASRLVQEALRRRIEGELPKPLADEVVEAVEPDLAPIRVLLAERKERYNVEGAFGKVDLALLPPCMQHLLGQLHKGENVAHNGRFAITTFLHKIGMSSEDIMKLFSQAPDFKEEMTRYQVEHITGVSSGTTYSVPGCDNLQTFNLCLADDLCRTKTKAGVARVRYPGDYYRYLVEAKPVAEAIAAKFPLEGIAHLVRALAQSYGRFKAFERLVASPYFMAMRPEDAFAALARRPGLVEVAGEGDGRRLVVKPDAPEALLKLVEGPDLEGAMIARLGARGVPPRPVRVQG